MQTPRSSKKRRSTWRSKVPSGPPDSSSSDVLRPISKALDTSKNVPPTLSQADARTVTRCLIRLSKIYAVAEGDATDDLRTSESYVEGRAVAAALAAYPSAFILGIVEGFRDTYGTPVPSSDGASGGPAQ